MAGDRIGAATLMVKFANMPERNSCRGILHLGADQNATSIRIDRRSNGRDFSVENAAGKGADPDFYLLSDAKRRTVGFGDIGQHPHGIDVGDRVGRRRIARLHQQTRRRIARRDPAVDRTWHNKRRVGRHGRRQCDLSRRPILPKMRTASRAARKLPSAVCWSEIACSRSCLRYGETSYRARAGAPDCGWSALKRLPLRSGWTSA